MSSFFNFAQILILFDTLNAIQLYAATCVVFG